MPIVFIHFLFWILLTNVATAGVIVGADIDDYGKRTWYLGAQTEGVVQYGVFSGQQQYALKNRSYNHRYMAGGVGYRWYGEWTKQVFLGLENSRLNESGHMGKSEHYFGMYAQLGLMKFSADKNIEFLTSYSQDSEQVWSRLRLRFNTALEYLFGPEMFVSRLLDSEILGAGLVLEKVFHPYTITAKLGIKDQSWDSSVYTGLELYRSF